MQVASGEKVGEIANREFGLLGSPQLIRENPRSTWWRISDAAIRVDHRIVDLHGTLARALHVTLNGIPTPTPLSHRVVVDGQLTYSVWEFVRSERDSDPDFEALGVLTKSLHERCSTRFTHAAWSKHYAERANAWVDYVEPKFWSKDIPKAALAVKSAELFQSAVKLLKGADTGVFSHGDLHPGNVLTTAKGPVLLDWEDSLDAPWEWDFVPLYTRCHLYADLPTDAFERFIAGYGRDPRGTARFECLWRTRAAVEAIGIGIWLSLDSSWEPEFHKRVGWVLGDTSEPWVWPAGA